MVVSVCVGVVLGLVAAFVGGARCRDHAGDGPHHGRAGPGAGDPHRFRAGAEPGQHHRRGDGRRSCRAMSASCARPPWASSARTTSRPRVSPASARLRLMFVDGAAELPRAADRAGGARRVGRHSRGRRAWASLALARSRPRPNGVRCWPTAASSSGPTPGSSRFPASPSSSPSSSINLMGDGLRDALDPKMKRS